MVADSSALRPPPALRAFAGHAARSALEDHEAQHDERLVQRFIVGDEAAFVEIVTRHRTRMFRAALGLLRNHADAEEIAQDTFIRAHRGLASFRGDSSLVAWLHCITLNLARNRYWYFHRRRRHATLPLDAQLGDNGTATYADMVPSSDPSPVREVVNNEFVAIISRCMQRLPSSQQQILELRNGQQYSYARIGHLLDIRIGTVKSRVARARRNLRALVGNAYPEWQSSAPTLSCLESLRSPCAGRGDLAFA
ncbi:MAG TPA: sigma-70 family RNA polymerase sigma factor [Lacunisphaera sp.]|jgi:RNA polymerase sigma-70 factor (ECF subfamily)|nr:sigma-70 family RNA polymerase sigma factor [Lacunisphaera sp.]